MNITQIEGVVSGKISRVEKLNVAMIICNVVSKTIERTPRGVQEVTTTHKVAVWHRFIESISNIDEKDIIRVSGYRTVIMHEGKRTPVIMTDKVVFVKSYPDGGC